MKFIFALFGLAATISTSQAGSLRRSNKATIQANLGSAPTMTLEFDTVDENNNPVILLFSRLYESIDNATAIAMKTEISFDNIITGETLSLGDFDNYWHSGLGGDGYGFGFDPTCIVDAFAVNNFDQTAALAGVSMVPTQRAQYPRGKITLYKPSPLAYLAIGFGYLNMSAWDPQGPDYQPGTIIQYVLKPTDLASSLEPINAVWTYSEGPNPFQVGNPSMLTYFQGTKPGYNVPDAVTVADGTLKNMTETRVPTFRIPAYFAEEFALDQTSGQPVMTYLGFGTITDIGSLNGLSPQEGSSDLSALILNEKYPTGGFPDKVFSPFSENSKFGAQYGFVKVEIMDTFDPYRETTYRGGYDMDYWSLTSMQTVNVGTTGLEFGVSGLDLKALYENERFGYVLFAPASEVTPENRVVDLGSSGKKAFLLPAPSAGLITRMKNPDTEKLPWGLGRFTTNPQVGDDASEEEQWANMAAHYEVPATTDVGVEAYLVEAHTLGDLVSFVEAFASK